MRLATVEVLSLFGVAAMAAGCSLVSSRPPPSAPAARTSKAAESCGSPFSPMADMLSTVAGVSWVMAADRWEEESRRKAYWTTPDGTNTVMSEPAGGNYDLVRYGGYGIIALFGASTLWGVYVEARCALLRNEVAKRRAAPPLAASVTARPNPPKAVLGFEFEMTQAQAAEVCAGRHDEWQTKGSLSTCAVGAPDQSAPQTHSVRLEFEAGTLHAITVLHDSADDRAAQSYDELSETLRKLYGAPQIEAAALSGACKESLAGCLREGRSIKGPVWHWSAESIALTPTGQDGRVVIEERYQRDADAPSD